MQGLVGAHGTGGRDLAEAQLTRFYAQLDKLGKRRASLDSGIAPMPNIDRFDTGETW